MDPLINVARPSGRAPQTGLGLYVHVPFCTRRCGYCDFSIVVGSPRGRDEFVSDVLREADLHRARADEGEPFATLSLGGGTPSLLRSSELRELIEGLRNQFEFVEAPEISIECNPESLDDEKIDACLGAGVTRFSVGVQSLDPAELRFLDRSHDAEQVASVMGAARRAGARDVSLDLIFGLPGQTLGRWQTTVEAALALEPDHVSAYVLTLEGKAPLARRRDPALRTLPAEEVVTEQYAWLQARLESAGLEQYEVSNFARPGHESVHNTNYWMRGEYLALGPAAHGHRRGRRWANASYTRWRAMLEASELPIATEERLSRRDIAEESIFLPLRTRWGIEWERLDPWLDAGESVRLRAGAKRLIDAGLLRSGPTLGLTRNAYILSDAIFSELVSALDPA